MGCGERVRGGGRGRRAGRGRTAALEQTAGPEGLLWPGRAESWAMGREPRAWPAASEDKAGALVSPSQQAKLLRASSWQRPRTFGALHRPGQIQSHSLSYGKGQASPPLCNPRSRISRESPYVRASLSSGGPGSAVPIRSLC